MKSASLGATSVGVNQVAECVDWGPGGLIAYGAHNQVILYDVQVSSGQQPDQCACMRGAVISYGGSAPQDAAVVATMRGHRDRVNCVTWLPRQGETTSKAVLSSSAVRHEAPAYLRAMLYCSC